MSYTTPTTMTTGCVVTACQWNANIRDNVQDLADFYGTMAKCGANYVISSSGTPTSVEYDTEVYDAASYFTTGSPAFFTVPAGLAGYYHITSHAEWELSSACCNREMYICAPNTSTVIAHDIERCAASAYSKNAATVVYFLNAGDKVYTVVKTSLAGSLLAANNATYMSINLLHRDGAS